MRKITNNSRIYRIGCIYGIDKEWIQQKGSDLLEIFQDFSCPI